MTAKKTVAIIGASADRSKFGNKSVRAHLAQGWEVYPVHPTDGEIDGLKTFRSVEEVPVELDRVSMYVPPLIGVKLLPAIAAAAPKEFFINPGAESDELVAAARALGLDPILACSIVAIGTTPAAFG